MSQNHIPTVHEIGWLPGTNILRSVVLCLLCIGVIVGFQDVPDHLPKYILKVSIWCSAFACFFALLSIGQSVILTNLKITDIRDLNTLFRPKKTVVAGVMLFFLIVCTWVIVLGGVLQSPFGSILTISPIFFVIEVVRKNDFIEYKKFIRVWLDLKRDDIDREEEIKKVRKIQRKIKIYEYSPIVVIVLTIVGGELLINYYDLNALIYENDTIIESIYATTWFVIMSYVIYYVAIIATLIGLIPADARANLLTRIVNYKLT